MFLRNIISICTFAIVAILLFNFSVANDLSSFDDTILFNINWPGKTINDILETPKKIETYNVITHNKEKYLCTIPDTSIQEGSEEEEYHGPTAMELIADLFSQNTCSYRLESYWTYELCHGKYIRQYHEDRDGKKINVQQYELGVFDPAQMKSLIEDYAAKEQLPDRKADLPVAKVDGISLPYVEIEMKFGTLCDLNNKPRSTKIHYICFENGKQDIYTLKEVSTCEYEAIVLTPILCTHPDYKPQDTGENDINCRPIEDAPKKPRSLMAMEVESLKLQHQKTMEEKPKKLYAIFRVDKDGQDGQQQVRIEFQPAKFTVHYTGQPLMTKEISLSKSQIHSFLKGANCITGGHGWWKYEFCFGRFISQFHVNAMGGTKTLVSLGEFNEDKHNAWLQENSHKKPKPADQRKQVSHFYSDGSYCQAAKRARHTEVILKCVTDAQTPSSFSMHLIEQAVCDYLLYVESPLFCELLQYADNENGIIGDSALEHLDKFKINLKDEDMDKIASEDE